MIYKRQRMNKTDLSETKHPNHKNNSYICVHYLYLAMKKLILTVIISLFIIPSQLYAQRYNEKRDMNILEERIKSLEHQVMFMRLYYDLQLLSTSMDKFAIGLNSQTNNIDLKIHQKIFIKQLLTAYEANYDSALFNKNAMRDNMVSLQARYNSIIDTYPFTKDEKEVLIACYNTLLCSYNVVETSLNLYQVTVEGYKSFL